MTYTYSHTDRSKLNDTIFITTPGYTPGLEILHCFTTDTKIDTRHKLTYYENQIRYVELNCGENEPGTIEAVCEAISYLCLRSRLGNRYPAELIRIHGTHENIITQKDLLTQAGYHVEFVV